MTSARVEAAIARARADARAEPGLAVVSAPPDGIRRARTLAIGDPQAPLETFLTILDLHGALGDDGRLLPDTALISMGDHFDWGKRHERARATDDGLALLAWLAAHPADQAILICGNHDLARVGELAHVSDAEFGELRARADQIDKDDAEANDAFRKATGFFSAELINRDFSTFSVAQRELVEALLRARRFRLAHARGDLLFIHAGITRVEVEGLGAPSTPATLAAALNAVLERAVDQRASAAARAGAPRAPTDTPPVTPLALPGLHAPGDASREGYGILYHRPSLGETDEERRELAKPRPRRRFDPRLLPHNLVQVIGHIRDEKCRKLMPGYADDSPARDGPLRHLIVNDEGGRYRHGLPAHISRGSADAVMLFLDAGMSHATPAEYRLFDVERRDVAEHVAAR